MQTLAIALSLVTMVSGITADLFADISPDSILALVNRDHIVSYAYKPEELVLPLVQAAPGKDSAIYLREEPARALEKMFQEAAADGFTLYAVSGFRSYAAQKSIYTRKVESVGEGQAMMTVAPPGTSEHQLGLTMDINGETTVSLGLVEAFGESPEGQWVYENAHRFGFIIRYAKDKTHITGYAWEPWHLRYVGKEAATEIKMLGIALEEYVELLQQRLVEAWLEEGANHAEP